MPVRKYSNYIEKTYQRHDLLSDDHALHCRLTAITSASLIHRSIPRTSFQWREGSLVLHQQRIYPVSLQKLEELMSTSLRDMPGDKSSLDKSHNTEKRETHNGQQENPCKC